MNINDFAFDEVTEAADLVEWEHMNLTEGGTIDLELTEEGKEALMQIMEEIGPLDIMSPEIESITAEDRTTGRKRKFYPEEKVMELKKAAVELLERYRKETEKQLAAVQLSAKSYAERESAKRKRFKRDKVVEKYREIFDSIGE